GPGSASPSRAGRQTSVARNTPSLARMPALRASTTPYCSVEGSAITASFAGFLGRLLVLERAQCGDRGRVQAPDRLDDQMQRAADVVLVDDAVVAVEVARRHGDVDHRRAGPRALYRRPVLSVSAEHVELQRDPEACRDLDEEVA